MTALPTIRPPPAGRGSFLPGAPMPAIVPQRLRLLGTALGRSFWGGLLVIAWGVAQSRADDQPAPAPAPAIDFVRDIKPIFVEHCHECHGPGAERGGLSLARAASREPAFR